MINTESLKEYFSKFGEVTEVMVMKDPTTRRSRGFGFVTFAEASSVDKVLAIVMHDLDGKKIDPKVAFPRRAHPKMVTRTKKIFVGGLSATTSLEDVKNYFEQFGSLSEENTFHKSYIRVRNCEKVRTRLNIRKYNNDPSLERILNELRRRQNKGKPSFLL
ncbi:hypothetical protein PGB90_003892 [Kerria lacca]